MHSKGCVKQSKGANEDLTNVHSSENVEGGCKGAGCLPGKCGDNYSHKTVGRSDDPGKACGCDDWSNESDSSSSSESSYGEYLYRNGDGAKSNESHGQSVYSVTPRECCCGNCSGCCHGDCGRYGHFAYHDDHGRSGELVGLGRGSKNKVDAARPPPDNSWRDRHPQCPGDSVGETSYLASKLKFESSQFEDGLNYPEHLFGNELFFSELRTKAISFFRLVNKAVAKLEHFDVLHEELYSSRQLLRFQKARNRRLQEDCMLLEMQLAEVNNDYGQLLVECDIEDKTLANKLMAQDSRCQTFMEKSTQTEQLSMVDVGTLSCPSNNTLSTQTEVCVDKKVGIRSDIISPVKGNVEKQVSTTKNGSEIFQEGKLATAIGRSKSNDETSDSINATSSCEGATALQSTGRRAAGKDETQGISCLPNKMTSTGESPPCASESDDRPLLSDQTREHAGERNGTSIPSITWPCDHYKRLCLVKFACCEEYYPCHRCHNKNGKCSIKNLKAVDAKFLKCLACNEVQKFTENSQNCLKCGIEFAKYFCQFCRHLTGIDEKPYHCSKCGICRVKSDKSFHCDNCGVCLDIQLRGNHVCREGSAHDPCCICFEDAFSGCQILPCGHKVHKDCATLMITNGIRSCPVCRQSFAHRLQRVPKSHS